MAVSRPVAAPALLAAQAAQARQRRWPVRELPGSHLHPLVAPADVASALIELTAACP